MTIGEEFQARLRMQGTAFEHYTHAPVPTAADRSEMGLDYHARSIKNLLVAPRNESRFLLLILPCGKTADLKALRERFGTARLQFAPEGRLAELLGLRQGTVGVCGLLHDEQHRIEVVFDEELRGAPRVATHPGVNTESVVLPFDELERFVRGCGNRVEFYPF